MDKNKVRKSAEGEVGFFEVCEKLPICAGGPGGQLVQEGAVAAVVGLENPGEGAVAAQRVAINVYRR